jgi:prepilin-type N-terminal cleavage/methylation domain-containing protein
MAYIRGRKNGFTLLEIVVAMGVLAIAMGTLLTTLNKTIYNVAQSASLTEAVTLAREEMERYRLERTGAFPTDGSAMEGDSTLKNELYPDLGFTRKTSATAIPGAYELIVTVFKTGAENPPELFVLRQYVVLKQGVAGGS